MAAPLAKASAIAAAGAATGENSLLTRKHVCLCASVHFTPTKLLAARHIRASTLEFVAKRFCGVVVDTLRDVTTWSTGTLVYVTGDLSVAMCEVMELMATPATATMVRQVLIVDDLSYGDMPTMPPDAKSLPLKRITVGQVPINMHGIGMYVRHAFGDTSPTTDIFTRIAAEHKFQELTDSNKPNVAFRTGIYVTRVTEATTKKTAATATAAAATSRELNFHLLRCSSNFSGPTDNLRATDDEILAVCNEFGHDYFSDTSQALNHVLAQIYWNHTDKDGTDKKAAIKAHSDKTKDMPRNALMAFCTFYRHFHGDRFTDAKLAANCTRSTSDEFDWVYRGTSVLTRLRFTRKSDLASAPEAAWMPAKFDVVLYPNSMFLMSLVGNRCYTHEIVPSVLPVAVLPTRLGYVVRCSKTLALHVDGVAHIMVGKEAIKMEPPTRDSVHLVKGLYVKENATSDVVTYPTVLCSLNSGDYDAPIL